MTNQEIEDRLRIQFSPLSGEFQVGVVNKKGNIFLVKRYMTNELLGALMGYLDNGSKSCVFSSDGKNYALEIREVTE